MAVELTKDDWRTIAAAAGQIDGGPLGSAAIPAIRYILVLGLGGIYSTDKAIPAQSRMLALLDKLRPGATDSPGGTHA